MAFMRNGWYCAAWSKEIGEKPFARTLLGEKLAFYRLKNGAAAAIGDVCPHHFAPLHLGRVAGDNLRCPYHGIEFGPNGKCAVNPHGATNIAAMRVSSYPIVERYGMAWIWMGDPALADPKRIPDLPGHDDPNFTMVSGYCYFKANYELIADNLVDLSHTQYLHEFFERIEEPQSRIERTYDFDSDVLVTHDDSHNVVPFGFTRFVWPDGPERVDNFASIRWEAPSNMLLSVFFGHPGQPPKMHMYGAELMTPETETTTHYFWTFPRDFRRDDEQFSQQLAATVQKVFSEEDGYICEQIQANMGSRTDLLDMQPALLRIDTAVVRSRRILAEKIAAEKLAAEKAMSPGATSRAGVPA